MPYPLLKMLQLLVELKPLSMLSISLMPLSQGSSQLYFILITQYLFKISQKSLKSTLQN